MINHIKPHERVLDIATLGAGGGLPIIARIAEECSGPSYLCHPGTWSIPQVTVQITVRGIGRCWPDGAARPHRDIPPGHALIYANRVHRRLVYGRISTESPWDFLYANLRGPMATLAIRDIAAQHHLVVPLTTSGALLAELRATLHEAPYQVWTIARSSGLALRLIAALVAVGDVHPTTPVDRLVAQAMAMLTSDRSLAAVARTCGVSREHLTRVFHQRTGESPGRWRRRTRMVDAARRILAGEPVATVATACSYADPGHFAAVFRSFTGLSPRAFRQSGGRPGWS